MSTIEIGDEREVTVDLRRAAKVLAVLLPFVGVAGVVGPYLLGFTSLAVLATYVALPSLLAPVLYLSVTDAEAPVAEHDRRVGKLLLSAYFAFQAVSVVLLVTNDTRPYSYYAVVAVLALIILLQILHYSTDSAHSAVILIQIVLLHLNVVWGVTLKYNYFIGRTDIFGHVRSLRILLDSGNITQAFGGFYQSFPLWHLLGAMEHLLFSGQLAPRTTLFVVSGLLYAFVPVGVYLVAREIFDGEKIALAAALLTGLNATVLHNAMYAIPRSAAAFFFVVVLLTWVWDDRRAVVLFAVFTVAIAAYHTVSLPFVFVILTVLYVFQRIVVPRASDAIAAHRAGTSSLLLSLVVVIQAAYWLFFAEYLLEHVVAIAFQQSAPGQVNAGVVAAPLRELANYLHHSALLVFVFVGSLVGLSSDRVSGIAKASLLATLVLVGVSFPGPHLLVSKLAESFNVLRFAQYAFPLVAVAGAYGLISLFRGVNSPGISSETIKVVALVVFVLFAFTTVSNDFVASDNPVVERQFYTNYLSEVEEDSMRTVGSISAGNVSSDYVATRYYEASQYRDKARILGVSENRSRLYLGSENDLVLVREQERQRRPLQVWGAGDYQPGAGYLAELRYVDGDARIWSALATENRVYDSGAATAYQRSNVTRANGTVENGTSQ